MGNIYVILAIVFGLWILQGIFSALQIQQYRKAVRRLSKKGRRLLTARSKGRLREGVIMVLSIDEDGIIAEAEEMRGITVFARFKPLPHICGKSIYDDHELLNSLESKVQQKAIIEALEKGVKNDSAELN